MCTDQELRVNCLWSECCLSGEVILQQTSSRTTSNMVNTTCLFVGTPRGFTRSVLESLLKRGSKVLFACSDEAVGTSEQKRLSTLYGPGQVFFSSVEPSSASSLDLLFRKAVSTLGEVNMVVNSTANNALRLRKEELQGDMQKVEKDLDFRLLSEDVKSVKLLTSLAVKHMGTHKGCGGGTVLNLSSGVELAGGGEFGLSTVLGTTRDLGLSKKVAAHGVKPVSVYQPLIDYPDLSPAGQITDDGHTPYSQWCRYSSYIREYTGYMALHAGDTAPAGSVWKFNQSLRVQEVKPQDLQQNFVSENKAVQWHPRKEII